MSAFTASKSSSASRLAPGAFNSSAMPLLIAFLQITGGRESVRAGERKTRTVPAASSLSRFPDLPTLIESALDDFQNLGNRVPGARLDAIQVLAAQRMRNQQQRQVRHAEHAR